MKVEQRPSTTSSERILENPSVSQRQKPQIITSDQLLQSIEILSKIEYQSQIIGEKTLYSHKQCNYCKNLFPTIDGRPYICKACNETLCLKHRDLTSHHCEKVLPNFEKYLMAKNIFKNKLREVKSKGHS